MVRTLNDYWYNRPSDYINTKEEGKRCQKSLQKMMLYKTKKKL